MFTIPIMFSVNMKKKKTLFEELINGMMLQIQFHV